MFIVEGEKDAWKSYNIFPDRNAMEIMRVLVRLLPCRVPPALQEQFERLVMPYKSKVILYGKAVQSFSWYDEDLKKKHLAVIRNIEASAYTRRNRGWYKRQHRKSLSAEGWAMICKELLEPQEAPPGRLRPAPQVNLSVFSDMQREGQTIIRDCARRAIDEADCEDSECSEPFIFGWMALNGWATCVTGQEKDFLYVRALMKDPSLNHMFDSQLGACDQLKEATQGFRNLWPIFRSQDVGDFPTPGESRQDFIKRCRTEFPEARYSPACYFNHNGNNNKLPVDWPHTISSIYQVRCNLFHGFKGMHSENDVAIVSGAFRVLVHVIKMLHLSPVI